MGGGIYMRLRSRREGASSRRCTSRRELMNCTDTDWRRGRSEIAPTGVADARGHARDAASGQHGDLLEKVLKCEPECNPLMMTGESNRNRNTPGQRLAATVCFSVVNSAPSELDESVGCFLACFSACLRTTPCHPAAMGALVSLLKGDSSTFLDFQSTCAP